MKRMSIAEQTLKKQIDNFKGQYKDLTIGKDAINNQMLELSHVIRVLELEMDSLEQARKKASEQRKP